MCEVMEGGLVWGGVSCFDWRDVGYGLEGIGKEVDSECVDVVVEEEKSVVMRGGRLWFWGGEKVVEEEEELVVEREDC